MVTRKRHGERVRFQPNRAAKKSRPEDAKLMNAKKVDNNAVQQDRAVEGAVKPVINGPEDKAWVKLVKFLLPDAGYNKIIQMHILEDIRNGNDPDMNSLLWKSFEAAMVNAAEAKKRELSDFLINERPDKFVDSPLNLFPKLMYALMMIFNWELISVNFIYIFLKKDYVYVKFGRKQVFLKLHVGISNFVEMQQQLTPFIDLFVKARVNVLYLKIHGYRGVRAELINYQRMLGFHHYGDNFEPGEFFKPCTTINCDEREEDIERWFYFFSEYHHRLYNEPDTTKFLLFRRSRRIGNLPPIHVLFNAPNPLEPPNPSHGEPPNGWPRPQCTSGIRPATPQRDTNGERVVPNASIRRPPLRPFHSPDVQITRHHFENYPLPPPTMTNPPPRWPYRPVPTPTSQDPLLLPFQQFLMPQPPSLLVTGPHSPSLQLFNDQPSSLQFLTLTSRFLNPQPPRSS